MSALISRAVLFFTSLANSFSLYIYIFVDLFSNFWISLFTLDGCKKDLWSFIGSTGNFFI
jgi:hypothetical protein